MLREGLKSWRRSPWVAAALTVILAIGIGGAAGVLALRDRVMLHPLPLPGARRLVLLAGAASPPDGSGAVAWYSHAPALAALCRYASGGAGFSAAGRSGFAYIAKVSPGFFAVAGVRPALGRSFSAGEQSGGAPVAIVSRRFWRRQLGGGPALGRTFTLNARTFTVIGIMPAGFEFPAETAVWIPQKTIVIPAGTAEPGLPIGFGYGPLIGRLRPGASARQATAEVNTLMHQAFAGSQVQAGAGAWVGPLRLPWSGSFGAPFTILLLAAGFLWFIACADAGWIVLVRTVARRRETAVRVALGAGQGTLLGHSVAECFWLVLWSAAGGWGVAMALIAAARRWGPAAMPGLDRPLLAPAGFYILALSAVSLAILSLLGSAVLFRGQVMAALQQQPFRGSRLLPRSWALLVAAQIGATLVIAGGAGVLLVSLRQLTAVSLGFSPRGVVAMQYAVPAALPQVMGKPLPPEAAATARRAGQDVLAAARREVGVGAVALSDDPPLIGEAGYLFIASPGVPPSAQAEAIVSSIGGEYFRLLKIPLIRGRYFRARDGAGAAKVATVSAAFARREWGGRNPIGREIQIGNERTARIVVGAVAAIRAAGPAGPAMALAQVYCPFAQPYRGLPAWRMTLLVRPAGTVRVNLHDLRLVLSATPGVAPLEGSNMAAAVAALLAPTTFWALIAAGASVLAAALAWLGVLGLFANWLTQHRQEIGIRMALGATPRAVLGAVAQRAAIVVAAGIVLGLVGGFFEAGILVHLVFGIRAFDGRIWAVAAALLAAGVLVAAAIPGWRAARIQPAEELRRE